MAMGWLQYMVCAAVTMAFHITAVKALGTRLSPVFTATIFLFIGGITTSLIYLFMNDKPDFTPLFDGKVIGLCLLAGVAIGLTDFFVATSYAHNAPMNIGYPLFATLSTLLLAISGYFIFKEGFSIEKFVGVAFALIGIFLITKD